MLNRLSLLTLCLFGALSAHANEDESREDLFLSTPEQVSSLMSESTYLIGGVVSPLSGQPVLRETDLVAKGAQNVILSRTYIPLYMPCFFPKHEEHHHKHRHKNHKHHKHHKHRNENSQEEYDKEYLYNYLREHYKGWQFFPHVRLQYFPNSQLIRLSDPSGMILDFHMPSSPSTPADLATPAYALHNTAADCPSAKYDPRNTRIAFDESRITVFAIDGTTRHYSKQGYARPHSHLYRLDKEILPNGKVFKYHYNDKWLERIESLDPQERYTYASIQIAGAPWEDSWHATSSSGTTVNYTNHSRRLHWQIKERINKQDIIRKENRSCPPVLASISSPFYRHETLDYCSRFLLGAYHGRDTHFGIFNKGYDDRMHHFRVYQLSLPVGPNDASVPLYEMDYYPAIAGDREGTTTVKNSDGTKCVYRFSKNLLTTCIQYFGQDNALKKEKLYQWTEKNWLKSIELKDANNTLLYRKSYEYDAFGNPILEMFTGDLTGDGTEQTVITKRTFSQDGRHLLLSEEIEDGKTLSFSYLPNTNLITSKLTKDTDQILLRTFSTYDDCNNLIQSTSDDGSSEDKDNLSHVTERTITTYALRKTAPFLHMPEWVYYTYWENGEEKSLEKRQFLYDKDGNVAQEEVYDAKETLRYTLYKTYNERGDILSETNALGQTALYTYDAKGRLETSTNFSNRIHKTCVHDTLGRLRKQTEQGNDGTVHSNSFDYDANGRLIHKEDPFQNSIYYAHDRIANQITETIFPPIQSLDGQPVPVNTHAIYDPFGRELTKTDANGNITTYRYNAYGSPTGIIHPNGAKEIFRYAKNGQQISYTDAVGLTIHYTNDILGRVLAKTTLSSDGAFLSEEKYTYKGVHLLTETDKEGYLKHYSYDGAGRKVREEFCSQITDYAYDALGGLATICKYNGDNTLLIQYERDLEGRIIQERKTDLSGRTLYRIDYSYDADGNRSTIMRHINGKEAVHSYTYDPFKRLIQETDPQGYCSITAYDEGHINSLGQQVLQIKKTDPLGISILETKDALNRTVKTETFNPYGSTIACRQMTHDPQGNLLFQRDHVYEQDRFHNTQMIAYTYTSDHHVESLTRAFDTPDSRTTSYRYTPSGKLAEKILPSNVALGYTYHPLGFLSSLTSSDGSIYHTFEYNRLGHLLVASDENQNITIMRHVDPFGNVVHEMFPFGFQVHKTYDAFNRLISLKMADQGEVYYEYDPLFLRRVSRGSRGKTFYTHTYENYDEDGNLILEDMIGNLGQVMHATDQNGQKSSLSSPYFSQEYTYDPVGNLTCSITDAKKQYYTYDDLSQLTSEKNHSLTYAYDSLYNRKDGAPCAINDLNELLNTAKNRCAYDLDGNQTLKHTPAETLRFIYDPLNRLIEASSQEKKVHFIYDPLGRRLSKTVQTFLPHGWKEMQEHYLYHGNNEIGAFTPHNVPKNLRVLGLSLHKDNPATIAIEIDDQIFAPLLDVQGNIRCLIETATRDIAHCSDFTAFGEEECASEKRIANPWGFASKRLDTELGLVYFGKRYYDPEFARWITTDPAGFIDSVNLYQYVLNNPFKYCDPNGEFAFVIPLLVWGAEFAIPALSAIVAPIVYTTVTAAATYAGYKAIQTLNEKSDGYSSQKDYDAYVKRSDAAYKEETKKKKPPYDGRELGTDPTQCPEEGFEWKGNGPPGSGAGSWTKGSGKSKESLYPDLKHPEPKGPHWDYVGPDFREGARLFPDGTWELK